MPIRDLAHFWTSEQVRQILVSRAAAKRTTGVSMSSVTVRANWPAEMSNSHHLVPIRAIAYCANGITATSDYLYLKYCIRKSGDGSL